MTQEILTSPLMSIDQAIARNPPVKICAHETLRSALERMYPDARWQFTSLYSSTELVKAQQDYGCMAFVYSLQEFVNSAENDRWRCDNGLIGVGLPVYSIPVAMAGAPPDMTGALSYWMTALQDTERDKSYLDYESTIRQRAPMCPMTVQELEVESDLIELDVLNFSLTLLIFAGFSILGLLAHCMRKDGLNLPGAAEVHGAMLHLKTAHSEHKPSKLSENEAAGRIQRAWRRRARAPKIHMRRISLIDNLAETSTKPKPTLSRRATRQKLAVNLPLPEPLRALSFGIMPDVQLDFSVTGVLHTIDELRAKGGSNLTSGYRVVGPASLFSGLTPEQSAALRGCGGRLSPLNHTQLSEEAKRTAGVPLAAVYVAFAYPVNRLQELRAQLNLDTEPWGQVLMMGGFWYFDAEKRLLQANTFGGTECSALHMHFAGPAVVTEPGVRRALETQGRMQRITIEGIRQQGLDRFGWVHATEKPGGYALSNESSYPCGAFVYVTTSSDHMIFYALEPEQQHQLSQLQSEVERPKDDVPARQDASPCAPSDASGPATPSSADASPSAAWRRTATRRARAVGNVAKALDRDAKATSVKELHVHL